MARVHHENHTGQRSARAYIGAGQRAPTGAHRLRDLRVSVARKVHQARASAKLEEVDGLRASGRLAGEREALAPGQGVDRARLAYVRAADEGELGRTRWRHVGRACARGEKLRLRERLHGSRKPGILIKSRLSIG